VVELVSNGEMNALFALFLFVLAIAVTGFVVFVERGQRRITVNYAKRQQGRKMYAAQSSHLPLKLNMAGVIPPIFASSIILFPTTLAQWAGNAEGMRWLQDIVAKLSPGEPIYVACMRGDHLLLFLLHRAGLQLEGHGRQPEAFGCFHPGYPTGRADRALHRPR
jgi:preprotein translocase subunit SecY